MLGLDAVEIARIKKIVDSETGPDFLPKVFTPRELAYCTHKGQYRYESLAARFAAKEAVGKALGVGIMTEADLTHIEVVNDEKGKPAVVLHAKAALLAQEKNIIGFEVSLTHTETTAYAVCLAKTAAVLG
ncbi:MAG: holo-ACP synthase [Candidatus Margulisbacteria bacterium]|jgi:holo-[acyl-carrier protein] synthase|nr:holo-ACP synthase [Candidatus Margulisiibacteriota bacterium]